MRSCTSPTSWLFSRLFQPGGQGRKPVITDYARGKAPGSAEFESYIEKTGYNVIEPREYGRLLEGAGFTNVIVDDATPRFIEILKSEADRLAPTAAISWRRSPKPILTTWSNGGR